MPDTLDHVAYLSREIGPRPAGTEEEQQAALYITERFQKDAGLPAAIEDFNNSSSSDELPRALCGAVLLVFAILNVVLPIMAIPSIIVCLIAALLFVAESFDKPILSRLLARGVSQNVVAKYQPGFAADDNPRRRKVVLVARYDSGKVASELNGPLAGILPIVKWVELGAVGAVVLLSVVNGVFFLHSTDVVALVFKVLLVVAALIAALPLVAFVVHRVAAYNEGANCNAAGVAVLMDVATRIGRGRVSEQELAEAEAAVLHGEDAARAEGLVPEGAVIEYADDLPKEPEIAPQSPAERLAAAKAAVAALTGKPVSSGISIDLASNLVQVKEPSIPAPTNEEIREMRADALAALSGSASRSVGERDSAGEAVAVGEEAMGAVSDAGEIAVSAAAPAQPVESAAAFAAVGSSASTLNSDVPAWFKSAQEKAKRPKSAAPVQRSRYADALDAAVRESSVHFDNANQAVVQETEQRLQAMRDSIMEVKAPTFARDESVSASPVAETSESSVRAATVEVNEPSPFAGEAEIIATQGASSFTEVAADQAAEPVDSATTAANEPQITAVTESEAFGEAEPAAEPIAQAQLQPFVSSVVQDEATQAALLGDDPLLQPTAAMPAIADLSLPAVEAKQAAPLAEKPASDTQSSSVRNLRTLLPSISGTISAVPSISPVHPASMSVDALRTTLPSLSGAISPEAIAAAQEQGDSFTEDEALEGATQALPAIDNDFLADAQDDFKVDDVDDSAYDGNLTATGAFAGPGYVDMPKSRASRLFGRFRSKKKQRAEAASSTSEWLDVDESFDARSVGAARGGWESFRQDDEQQPAYVDGQFDDQYEDDGYDDYDRADDTPEPAAAQRRFPQPRRWNGGAFSRRMMGKGDLSSEEVAAVEEPQPVVDDVIDEEIGQVYRFRHPEIDTEVWFVALGAELEGNAGMNAFLSEHAQELRGAVIVELDALGAGELSLITRESPYRSVKASSRMKRYVKKASQDLGLNIPTAELRWQDGSASYAAKHGFQSMHLAGMDGCKQALCGQQDDVLENIDPDLLELNADFVMELLKKI